MAHGLAHRLVDGWLWRCHRSVLRLHALVIPHRLHSSADGRSLRLSPRPSSALVRLSSLLSLRRT